MSISSERIVWIDCEMTGLDLTQDALIEVGVLVTDSDLNILGEGVELVIKPGSEAPAGALENMNSYVRNMHESSGLLEDLEHGVSMHEAQEAVLKYVKKYVPVAGKAQLGGNSVGMDKRFLERDMPDLMKHLHYRVIDVSTIKELAAPGTRLLVIMRQLRPETIVLLEISKTRLMNSNTTVAQFLFQMHRMRLPQLV